MATRAELVALLRECRKWYSGALHAGQSCELMDRIDAALAEPEAGKTVRVRCCVAMTRKGHRWVVAGKAENVDGQDEELALDSLGACKNPFTYMAEILVPIPQAVEVEGEVSDG